MRSALRWLCLAVPLAAMMGCGGGGGGGGGDNTPADWVCNKMVSCGMFPSQYKSICMSQAKAVEMYVVDPEASVACLQSSGVTCSDLMDLETSDPTADPPAWLTTCLAYDTASFQCSEDETTLHFCNTSAACKDVSCSTACKSIGYSAIGCGVSPKGYQQCTCG